MRLKLLAGLATGLVAAGADAAIVNYNYVAGYHNNSWYISGSNGASFATVYGDGQYASTSPQNKCIDGTSATCASKSGTTNGTYSFPAVVVAGDNGPYWTNVGGATPVASFAGSLSYDDAITYTYTDVVRNTTETWYLVTGGSLAWTGTYGIEVTVGPASNGQPGGSFFSYSFANGNINLTTGVRTSTSKCDLGIAGGAIVGPLLCGAANPASTYQYSSVGAYVKPVNFAMVKDNGDGSIDLMIWGNRRTTTGSANDLQERFHLLSATVPVPGAVWLLGSAVAFLGVLRRRVLSA